MKKAADDLMDANTLRSFTQSHCIRILSFSIRQSRSTRRYTEDTRPQTQNEAQNQLRLRNAYLPPNFYVPLLIPQTPSPALSSPSKKKKNYRNRRHSQPTLSMLPPFKTHHQKQKISKLQYLKTSNRELNRIKQRETVNSKKEREGRTRELGSKRRAFPKQRETRTI